MKSQVKLSSNDSIVQSAIMIRDSKTVLVSGSTFKNLASNVETGGGALSIIESSTNKAYSNSFTIDSCAFDSCQGVNGGAISFINTGGAQIRGSTVFTSNTATVAGGALYFNCQNYELDFDMCSLDIADAVFQKNFAGIEGGALKWNIYEPMM